MKNNVITLLLLLLLSACSTVHKTKSSNSLTNSHVDNSSQEKQYSRETTIEELGTVPVTISADSAQTSGTILVDDTATYYQEVETDGIILKTTVKPKVSNGKTAGYDIYSKAVAKPKTIDAPVNKITKVNETGIDKYQATIQETKTQSTINTTKDIHRFNIAGAVALIGCITVLLIVVAVFLYLKREKPNKE